MHRTALWAIALFFGMASMAIAQDAPYSQTLDEQLMRVRAGKPAVPRTNPAAAPETAPAAGMQKAAPVVTPPVAPDGEIIQSQGGGAIPALPLQAYKTQSGIQYITGGIGDEELAQLKSVEQQYNVQILIAATSGAYISGVTVRIKDAAGNEVLAVPEAGPYLYTHLAPGNYTMSLTNSLGVAQQGSFTVKDQGVVKPTVRFAD